MSWACPICGGDEGLDFIYDHIENGGDYECRECRKTINPHDIPSEEKSKAYEVNKDSN